MSSYLLFLLVGNLVLMIITGLSLPTICFVSPNYNCRNCGKDKRENHEQ